MPDLLNFAFQILIALLVYVIGGRIIKWITKLVRRSMDRAGTDEGVKQFMIPVIKYSLYVVLIFIIMGLFGIATTSAVAVLGSAGVAVGLALQGSLSNFAGGVLILLLKPFKVGEITSLNIPTIMRERSRRFPFFIPNSYRGQQADRDTERTLSNSSLTNVTNKDRRRVDLVVGIAYEADIRTAKDVIYAVAEKEEARIPEEKPVVYVDNLAASSVDIGLGVWVKTEGLLAGALAHDGKYQVCAGCEGNFYPIPAD